MSSLFNSLTASSSVPALKKKLFLQCFKIVLILRWFWRLDFAFTIGFSFFRLWWIKASAILSLKSLKTYAILLSLVINLSCSIKDIFLKLLDFSEKNYLNVLRNILFSSLYFTINFVNFVNLVNWHMHFFILGVHYMLFRNLLLYFDLIMMACWSSLFIKGV